MIVYPLLHLFSVSLPPGYTFLVEKWHPNDTPTSVLI